MINLGLLGQFVLHDEVMLKCPPVKNDFHYIEIFSAVSCPIGHTPIIKLVVSLSIQLLHISAATYILWKNMIYL